MPYRGESEPRIACGAHAAAEAAASCSRCHVALCDPCTLYHSAEPYCRSCVGRVRRAWAARIGGGVAALSLTVVAGTAGILASMPVHSLPLAAVAAAAPVRHDENCQPADRWLADAETDATYGRWHAALHHLSLSQRDCAPSAERDHLYALAYHGVGDHIAAIAAASRWVDSSKGDGDACALFTSLVYPDDEVRASAPIDPRCAAASLAGALSSR